MDMMSIITNVHAEVTLDAASRPIRERLLPLPGANMYNDFNS